MSKKNFIDGLESVFDENSGKSFQDDNPLFSYEAKSNRDPNDILTKDDKSNLEELEEEEETVDTKDATTLKKHRKPLTGLDLLIRKTAEPGEYPYSRATMRKVSLTFDRILLSKLKAIARLEKMYFRELVNDILTKFVDNYEKEKGHIDHEG